MRRQWFVPALIVALLATGGCAREAAPEPFPQEVADQWMQRWAAGDAAGVAALYTEDAQLLPPNQQVVTGRAAIQEFVVQADPASSPPLEVATLETLVFGDYAHRQGSFMMTGPDGAVLETGKFIELWKKVDGSWKIHRDMWSPDAMPSEPPLVPPGA